MNLTIIPRPLRGHIRVIPSKSVAHRYLICAAFGKKQVTLLCPDTNRDIEATADCLRALGAEIVRSEAGYCVTPVRTVPEQAVLDCWESGSTLRFLLPVAGALGVDAVFKMEGRLPQRPLSPLWEEMERMGCALTRPTENTIRCTGKLRPGEYVIDGGVSSQFITGLLFAHRQIDGPCGLTITGKLESAPYVALTKAALALFSGNDALPDEIPVEGDWSNGAFWMAAAHLGSDLTILGLDPESVQGDRAADFWIPRLTEPQTIDASDIPDLVPILSVVAAAGKGAVFTGIRRLRLKESDRVASTMAMIQALGGRAEADAETMTIHGTGLSGGTVDAANDHRIAMAAAIAATVCREPVTILGAQCVEKSYPQFWEEYARLSGRPVIEGDSHGSVRTASE